MPAAMMDLFNIVLSPGACGACCYAFLTKQDQGQLAFSRLIAVFRDFVRPRRTACKSRLQENIFACFNARNIARRLRNDFNICTRDARKTHFRNRQYADFVELVKLAIEAPSPCPSAAFFLTKRQGRCDARLENLITV
jgi:hypothetical protein